MKHTFYTQQHTGHAVFIKLLLLSVTLIGAFTLTACEAKEPDLVSGLGVELLNYSQESVYSVNINGNLAGNWAKAAKIGEAKGGGFFVVAVRFLPIKTLRT